MNDTQVDNPWLYSVQEATLPARGPVYVTKYLPQPGSTLKIENMLAWHWRIFFLYLTPAKQGQYPNIR